jgi:SAM-dependent methyltransferase
MSSLNKHFLQFSKKSREKRAKIFRDNFEIREETSILDIGSEDGSNINFVLQETKFQPENIFIADIDKHAIEKGAKEFGFKPVLLDESGKLPFAEEFFDIVYCSSVIEHATVSKSEMWSIKNGKQFREISFEKQKTLAEEIRRVGKSYFVQTPSRNFPIESHSWLPLVSFLPRPMLLKTLKTSNRFWIKKTIPDYNLLDKKEMKKLFPDAEILTENKFGLVKSIIAIKN